MEITEVRIKLMEDGDDRLQAFCSITFDHCFVVRDLKIIEGANGPFVAMPSRKLTAHCPRCRTKNHLRANYCNHCGLELEPVRAPAGSDGRMRLYADIAHPIHAKCREMIQERVVSEFYAERERAKEPGYVSRYDEVYDGESVEARTAASPETSRPRKPLPSKEPDAGRRHLDEPVSEPPPPHMRQSGSKASSPQEPARDDFGAGIFDD
ncbi:MAG TPA: stage V sporulation protein G [Planctomycetaceae bacterium]|nr:stage V sporulation protein G [Planctomycetaceae bacterium]